MTTGNIFIRLTENASAYILEDTYFNHYHRLLISPSKIAHLRNLQALHYLSKITKYKD